MLTSLKRVYAIEQIKLRRRLPRISDQRVFRKHTMLKVPYRRVTWQLLTAPTCVLRVVARIYMSREIYGSAPVSTASSFSSISLTSSPRMR